MTTMTDYNEPQGVRYVTPYLENGMRANRRTTRTESAPKKITLGKAIVSRALLFASL